MTKSYLSTTIALTSLLFTMNAWAASSYVPAKDAAQQIKEGKALLIDVREAGELEDDGIAQPAYWLATSAIKAKAKRYHDFMALLPKDKTIYVYCEVGGRAGRFVEDLAKAGFKAENIGGLRDWQKAKLPVKPLNHVDEKKSCPYLCPTKS